MSRRLFPLPGRRPRLLTGARVPILVGIAAAAVGCTESISFAPSCVEGDCSDASYFFADAHVANPDDASPPDDSAPPADATPADAPHDSGRTDGSSEASVDAGVDAPQDSPSGDAREGGRSKRDGEAADH